MSEESGLSAAQLRAKKRQEKIRASANSRINKITTNARGEQGAEYLKNDTPFDKPVKTPDVSTADPDDIDLSLASLQRTDPTTGFTPPSNGPNATDMNPNDMLAQMFGGSGVPPELADNPLFAMLQNMSGGQGDGQQNPFAAFGGDATSAGATSLPPAKKSTFEKLLPLLHLLCMIALVSWAVWSSEYHSIHWASLSTKRSLREYVVQSASSSPASLIYGFITLQLILQSIQLLLVKETPPPPSLLNSVLPMIPHPFGMWIRASIKYYALAGQVLDDLSVVLVGLAVVVLWHRYQETGTV